MLSKLKLLVLVCFFIPSLVLAQSVSCKSGACIPIMLQSISPLNEVKLNSAADNLLNKDAFPKGDRKAARKLNEDALKQLNAGNVQPAIALLKQAVETDPSDVEISSNYGFALLKSGNYAAAQNSLSKTLELNPRRTSTWLPLAEAYAGSGQAQIAKQAGLIAFFYSTDKDKAQAYYLKQSQEQSIAPIKAMYASLVGDIGNQQVGTSTAPAIQAPKAAPAPAPVTQAPSQPSQQRFNNQTTALCGLGIMVFKKDNNFASKVIATAQNPDASKEMMINMVDLFDLNTQTGLKKLMMQAQPACKAVGVDLLQ